MNLSMKKIAIVAFTLFQAQLAFAWKPEPPPPEFKPENLKVFFPSPEQADVLKSGGLGDVAHSLPKALRRQGVKVEVGMPFWSRMDYHPPEQAVDESQIDLDYKDGHARAEAHFSVLKGEVDSVPTVFFRHDETHYKPGFEGTQREAWETWRPEIKFFENAQDPYGPAYLQYQAFASLAKAQWEYIKKTKPDVVVLNDWTTGYLGMLIHQAWKRGEPVPKVAFMLHNMAYQGNAQPWVAQFMGDDPKLMGIDGYEFHGQMSYLKSGLGTADLIIGVSKTYSQETTTPAYGAGLDGLMFQKGMQGRLTGIMNGFETDEWDTTKKTAEMPYAFSEKNFLGKTLGKKMIQQQLGFEVNKDIPMFVLTSRLAQQKGLGYMLPAVEKMLRENQKAQFVIIGKGEPEYVEHVKRLAAEFPTQVHYEEWTAPMEHKLIRYGDFFVNHAWFEPAGLNQLYAMFCGTVPIVTRVGGLKETVKHMITGIMMDVAMDGKVVKQKENEERSYEALMSGMKLFGNKKKLRTMRRAGMAQDNSWDARMPEYMNAFKYMMEKGWLKIMKSGQSPYIGKSPSELNEIAGIKLWHPPHQPMACQAIFAH